MKVSRVERLNLLGVTIPGSGTGNFLGHWFVTLLDPISVNPMISQEIKERTGKIIYGVVNYLANVNKACPKERVEVYHQGRNLSLDNFRELRGYGFKGFKKLKTRQDKGHAEQFRLFAERIRTGGEPLIPLGEILNVAEASLAAVESLVNGEWVNVGIGFSREGTQRAQKEREGEPEPLKV